MLHVSGCINPCVLCPLPPHFPEHINKQIERGYAEKDVQLTFWPTNLGESLISSYRWGQVAERECQVQVGP